MIQVLVCALHLLCHKSEIFLPCPRLCGSHRRSRGGEHEQRQKNSESKAHRLSLARRRKRGTPSPILLTGLGSVSGCRRRLSPPESPRGDGCPYRNRIARIRDTTYNCFPRLAREVESPVPIGCMPTFPFRTIVSRPAGVGELRKSTRHVYSADLDP